jgi:hypothetical protein
VFNILPLALWRGKRGNQVFEAGIPARDLGAPIFPPAEYRLGGLGDRYELPAESEITSQKGIYECLKPSTATSQIVNKSSAYIRQIA